MEDSDDDNLIIMIFIMFIIIGWVVLKVWYITKSSNDAASDDVDYLSTIIVTNDSEEND